MWFRKKSNREKKCGHAYYDYSVEIVAQTADIKVHMCDMEKCTNVRINARAFNNVRYSHSTDKPMIPDSNVELAIQHAKLKLLVQKKEKKRIGNILKQWESLTDMPEPTPEFHCVNCGEKN